MRLLILCATFAFSLTTCVAPKEASRPQTAPPINTTILVPPPHVSRPAVTQPEGHWTDWNMVAGSWSYTKDDRGSIARYGAPGQDAIAMLRCDKGRARVFLSRAGTTGGSMTVRTSSTSKAVTVQPTGTQPSYVVTELTVSDPVLDAMAFSRGRVAFELAGAQNIAIPVWSEIGRVVEDCRA